MHFPPFRDPATLTGHIAQTMAFYHPRAIDPTGGFHHYFKDDGTVYDAASRHLVSSTRFIFNYAQAYRQFGDPAYLDAVRHGLAFVRDVHRNPATGGYAWQLHWQDGVARVTDADNHCYGLAFVLLAYAHAYQAGVPEARDHIDEVFALMEQRFWEEEHGLYADQANADWSVLSPYRGQNANMHCCEALLAAYEATDATVFLHRAEQLAHNITVRQAALADGLVWEHYGADWSVDWNYSLDDPKNLFRPWGFQPGHLTEWAKLLLNLERHGARLHRPSAWLLPRAQALFAAAVDHAWDAQHGGLCYGFGLDGRVCDDDKYFWVQAETIAAAAVLAVRTGAAAYWEWYERLWAYSWQHFVDHRYGAWYRILGADNRTLGDEKSPAGKTDYHTMGACYEVLKALARARPWLATYQVDGIPASVDADAFPSVVHLLEDAMDRFAGQVAFRAGAEALTYAHVDRQSRDFAAWLQHALHIKPGDRVALMLPNVLAFPVASIGILRAGAVQVNVNPLYTARELAHQLNDAGVTVIVVCEAARAVLDEIRADTCVRHVLVVDPADGASAFADALHAGAQLPLTPVALQGDDTLFLQYTGGTSGVSKGAVLTHRNLLANIAQFKALSPDALRPGAEVIVTAIPLYHIFALMVNFLAYFSVGAQNWLVANPRDTNNFIDVLKAARPTVFVGVNTLYAGLLAHPRIGEVDFAPLRLSIGGGAAVVRVVSDQWLALTGTFIREGYGLTETSPVLTFNPASVHAFTGSAGLPLPGTDICLLDDDGALAAPGVPGEICVRGPQVMRGYWQQPQANLQAFTADGYFKTGDIGVFDGAGFLSIVDRKKDIVLVSGFNVYPNEVEAVASSCPGVAECACAGMPDARSGEALVLFIVTAPGATLDAATVVAHCRTMLTAYKVPKDIRFVAALPKSTVGKILRRELRLLA